MNNIENLYQAHCFKCGYDWTKKTTKDPLVCPSCNSRKWKEPSKEKTRKAKVLPFYATDKCFFDPMLVCENTSSEKMQHYCRDCKHLPILGTENVPYCQQPYTGSLEHKLCIAIGSSRQKAEKKFIVNPNSQKVPEWAHEICGKHLIRLDHTFFKVDEYGFSLITEPYHLYLRDLQPIIDTCEKLGLFVTIDGSSSHFPGSCLRIEIREVAEYERRKDLNQT
jgi:DNA-directed RNA polymerase subunit RPC12/RpoP